MENKVLLSDILINWFNCRDAYKEGTTNQEAEKALQQYKQDLFVQSRLTMSDKTAALLYIAWSFKNSERDAVEATIRIECAKILYCLLVYSNIDNDMGEIAMSPATIDALYDSGIVDDILKFCESDYRHLEQMVDRMLNYSNLFKMVEMFDGLDADKLEKTVKTMKKTIQGLDAETVKNLATITQQNDPMTAAVAGVLSEQGLLQSDELAKMAQNTEK
nr:MAG TPA: hypothetical protein [Caudoviricetes sp.]